MIRFLGALLVISMIIGAFLLVIYVPQIWSWWRLRTWMKRKEQADELAELTINELEEQLKNDEIVHFLTPKQRKEYEIKLREYKEQT